MSKKLNNNLFKVTNSKKNYVHYFTSLNRIADTIGVFRASIEWALLKNQPVGDFTVEVVDGYDVMYKDIN